MRLLLATVFPLGLLAAVNPCGFPLLPAYLARFSAAGRTDAPLAARARASLLNSAAMTLGFVAVFSVVGATASLVLHAVLAAVPALLVMVGAALVLIAVLSVLGRMPAVGPPARVLGRGAGPAAAFGFGVAYGAGSLGCALPLFAAAIGDAAATHGWTGALVAGAAYALGMGVLVAGIGLLVTMSGSATARRTSGIGRITPLLGAIATGVTGVCLAFVGLRDLGVPGPAVILATQGRLAAVLGASPALLGAALGAVVVAWLVVVAAHELRTGARR
ncbi:MAG TPA: cytochrome c biogenesis protein CcdA [Amnibacterium sp.]|jgi:cytochrome c biogenesis protein CcdA|uniref:cytochrome c biogenesis CcdA family protein n=1 Tax=Amnibacterium sp. TaxID=1872496 RepID=UPI002F9255E5